MAADAPGRWWIARLLPVSVVLGARDRQSEFERAVLGLLLGSEAADLGGSQFEVGQSRLGGCGHGWAPGARPYCQRLIDR